MTSVPGVFLAGEWVRTTPTREVVDAWSTELVAEVELGSVEHARRAVDAAEGALVAGLPPHARRTVLHRVAALVEERAELFAEAIRIEVDKPVSAARAETARAAQTFRFAAEEAGRIAGETVPLDAVPAGRGTTAFTLPEPLGIVAAITPFNFPLNLSAHKIGPAIAAGCPVVFKPAARCPLTARLLVEAFADAGLPAGFLNLVCGPAAEIVDVWQADPRVEVINFTGSPAVGWALKAASPRKHHILELGSTSAAVIHADADLDRAVEDCAVAGYAFSGQVCISLQRVLVHARVADSFLERLAERVRALPCGDPRDPATVVAPLVTVGDAERLEAWIASAESAGAMRLAGGPRTGGLLPPTLLAEVPVDADVMRREAFGPVVAAVRYDTLEEAIGLVNDSDFGLNTSIYTESIATALRFAREVRTGQVLVNLPTSFRTDNMPYGGVKDSGQGVEGVRYAVAELTRQKLVAIAGEREEWGR